jgi:hypothetical protein
MSDWRRVFVLGLLAGAFVCVAINAGGAETFLSTAPPAEPQFQPGDIVVVAAEQAKLMRGDELVATVPQGRRVVVVEVRQAWVGTHVMVNDENKAGWIHMSHFLPLERPAQVVPAAQGYSAAYPSAAYLSEAATVPSNTLVTTRESVQAGESDPYLVGRQQRHETDPNMHVWEPWRR